MVRPALSVTVFVTGAGALAEGVREVMAAWTAAGLVEPSVWAQVGPGLNGPAAAPELEGVTLSGDGLRLVAVRDELAAQPYGVVRLVALLPCTADAPPERAAVTAVRRLGDRLLQGALGRGQRLVRMVLLVPDRDDVQVEARGLLMPAFDANVVVAPEDRAGDHQAATGVAGERFYRHAALAAATLAGLWRGQDGGPFDDRNPHSLGNEAEVVVARPFARLVEAGFLVDRVTAEVLNPGPWPVPVGVAGEPAPNPAGLVEDAAAELLDVHAGVLGYQPPSDPALLERPVSPPWASEPVIRRLVELAADATEAGDESGDEAATRILEVIEAEPPPEPDPRPWQDLRQVCFGLIDGGPLPAGIATRAEVEGRRLIVLDPACLAPPPVDGDSVPDGASLCARVGDGIAASLGATRRDLHAALADVAAGDEDPWVQAEAEEARRRWPRWRSGCRMAAGGALGLLALSAVLGPVAALAAAAVLVVAGMGAGLSFVAHQQRGRELEERRSRRADAFAFALVRLEHTARAVVRLKAAFDEFVEWSAVIGRLVHEPWGPPPAVDEDAGSQADDASLRALQMLKTDFSPEAVTRLTTIVGRDLMGRGWLGDRYAHTTRQAMEALAARWGLAEDEPRPDPDDPVGTGPFPRSGDGPRAALLEWLRGDTEALRRDVEALVAQRCAQEGAAVLDRAGSIPGADTAGFVAGLAPPDPSLDAGGGGPDEPAAFISTLWRDEVLMNTPSRVASVILWVPEPPVGAAAEQCGTTRLTMRSFRPPARPRERFLVGAARVDLAHPCSPEHLAIFRRPTSAPVHPGQAPSLVPRATNGLSNGSTNGSSSKEY